ncbi:MAG: LysM peptidoglycan-binding domain-containing protein [Nitrospira sp.]|nr:LysM peptidoglycan-binding domain-containing protein [Nitrospira sp.]
MTNEVEMGKRGNWRQAYGTVQTGALIVSSLLLSGCVVLEEKYEAEKARSLNFQRLLAQEERRAAELEREVKQTKRELMEFEARNRELLAQVQTLREQMTRLQEEAEAVKEAALLERKALEELRKVGGQPIAKAKKNDPPAEPLPSDDEGQKSTPKAASSKVTKVTKGAGASQESLSLVQSGTIIHVVKPGDTLFRLSRRYGVETEKLKEMNKLTDDIIEVGQRLVITIE